MAKNNTSSQKLVSQLEQAVDESKKLVKLTDATNDLYIEIAKNIKTSFSTIDKSTTKGLSELNKALANTNTILEKQEENNKKRAKANDDLEKQEKKLVTLRNKLNDGLSEGAIETEKLNTQIREQNKKRKEAVNDSLGLVSAYSKESKALRKMKNDLKSNIIEMRKLGKSEKEIATATKKTAKEINKLDRELRDLDKSVGDSFREIGKYEEALESLSSTANTVKGALVGVGTELVAGLLVESITSNREAQLELDKLQNKAQATAKVLGDALSANLFDETLEDRVFKAQSELFDGIGERTKLKLEARITFTDEGKAELKKEQEELEARLEVLSTTFSELNKEWMAATAASKENNEQTTSTIDGINNTIEALDNLSEKTQDVEIANNALERSLAEQIKVQQKLKAIAADDNRGLDEGNALKEELAKQNKVVAETQEKIARNQIKIQTLAVGAELLAKNKISIDQALNLTSEEANELLKDRENLLALSSVTEEAYTQAYVGYVEARTEAEQTALETQETRTKLLSDTYEKDLDILIDYNDTVKTLNEKIIADDTISNERRQTLLNETKRLTEKSFKSQAKVIEDFTHKRIDLDSTTTASQKKALKEKVSASDIESLLRIKDARELNDKIRELGLSEIFEGRTLEVIREKIIANADFIESQKEVNIALAKTNEINEDIADQEELLKILRDKEIDTQKELDDAKDKLEAERLQNRLDAIEVELEAVKKGSLDEAVLNQEKNEIILEQETIAADKRIAEKEKERKKEEIAEKEAIQARQDLLKKAEEVLENQIRKQSEKRIAAIDGELEQNQKRIEQINQAIQDGNEEAKESLAIEEKRAVELEAKKEKERKKALKLEAGIAILKAFGENDGDLGKTIGDTTALIAFINSLPSFFDGTEDTGGASSPLDSNGGRLTMLHDNERVMTAEQNKKLGGISNDDLADLGAMHGKGLNDRGVTINKANDDRLISEIRDMKNVIKSMPTPSYNWNATDRMHEMTLTSHNKKETLKQRSKNIFR